MRKRTLARELALKALYQEDLRGGLPADGLATLCQAEEVQEVVPFGRELLEGCLANREAVDKIIEETVENWRLDRMPIVDRNILRLATYEMVYRDDTPPKVAINEAIELAKKYSTENSPVFVNGVLDRIYATHARERKPSNGETPEQGRRACLNFTPDPLARADLHVHSSASDGSLRPEEVVRTAASLGLSAIALTDHDTVEGVLPAERAATEAGIRVIPSVELTAYSDGEGEIEEAEVHVVGLFVDVTDAGFLADLRRMQQVRVERIRTMSEKLEELGCHIRSEDVLSRARGESVGRVHMAQQMVEQGICANMKEAFDRYIGAGMPAYVPKDRLTPRETIEMIRRAGGCPVLAHPGCLEGLEDMLKELMDAGLLGIEVHHPGHTPEDECRFLKIAREFGLAVSGGSDFHGDAKPQVSIGQECVSLIEVCELAERAKQ